MTKSRFDALIAYEDPYVQPLILEALKSQLPSDRFTLIQSLSDSTSPLLQFRAYESLDFERSLHKSNSLINAYVIRKALIRKHYLSQTIFTWITKHPDSALRLHFKPAVDFELDYAEFLDDALVEAFELRASFEANESKPPNEREWWILKPGMSDRGQGIRLFSTEEELRTIFEEWEEDQDDSTDGEDEDNSDLHVDSQPLTNGVSDETNPTNRDYIVTSHLRHFIAQPYIHPPLLLPQSPYDNRKFHIRTYVVAAGALRIYVYSHMLALFASSPYHPPWAAADTDTDAPDTDDANTFLQRMRDIHLTNTCVQSASRDPGISTPHVFLVSDLPLTAAQHGAIAEQINAATAELFRAALALPTHFQPLPGAFEIFGVDFLVESLAPRSGAGGADVNVQLLEVNAFPDFAQTGEELRDVVVKGLFEEVVRVVVGPFFDVGEKVDEGTKEESLSRKGRLTKVLDVNLGRT